MARLYTHHARGLRGAVAARKRRAERDRHFTEILRRRTPADRALDAVDHFGNLDLPREHDIDRALVTLVHRVLSGGEMDVRGRLRQALEFGLLQPREQRDRGKLVDRQHGFATGAG